MFTEEQVLKSSRQLSASIRYDVRNKFKHALENGADINLVNENTDPAIFSAITSTNMWAFNELLKMKDISVNKYSSYKVTPLHTAAARGHEEMVQTLINHGAKPTAFCSHTILHSAIEGIGSYTVLENSIWSTELKDLNQEIKETKSDATLKKEVQDYFYKQGKYANTKPGTSSPFVTDKPVLQVYYEGKPDIIGILLSAGTSPFLPASGTDRSSLNLVLDSKKYTDEFQAMEDEELTYLGSEGNDILNFSMKFRNKSIDEDSCINIIVHYDMRPSRTQILEFVKNHPNQKDMQLLTEAFSKKIEDDIAEKQDHLHGKLGAVQQELSLVKELGNFDRKQDRANFALSIKGHPNQEEAHRAFQIDMEAIRTYAIGVKGGAPVGEGSLAMVKTIIDVGGHLANFVPVVGPALSNILGWGSTATQKLDETRETNLTESISALATNKESTNIFEVVSRTLVDAYSKQYERLMPKEEAEEGLSKVQKIAQQTKEKVLSKRFMSAAEQATAFAMLWIVDEVFHNAHTTEFRHKMKEKGLETLLVEAVTQKNPPEKIKTFWNKITRGLGIESLRTKTGETWHPADFWTLPGVMVQTEAGTQYFSGKNNKPEIYGWRHGSLEDVKALGLQQVTAPAANNSSSPLIFATNNGDGVNGGHSNGTRLHHQPSYAPPLPKQGVVIRPTVNT